MGNSPLVNYTKISPNRTSPRNHSIDTVTIHCVVGQLSVERLGEIFAPASKRASSNYGIGADGRIGMYVEEKDRSWCSSNEDNDNRAITIEVASDTKHPYAVNSAAYKSLLTLLTDICMRNNIKELKWKGDKSLIGQPDKQNMTVHRWFDNNECPGEYLYSRHARIAAEVNERLKHFTNGNPTEPEAPAQKNPARPATKIGEGDTVSLCNGARYYNGTEVPNWIIRKHWIVKQVSGERVVIDKSTDGKNSICSPVHAKYLTVVKAKSDTPYMVKVDLVNLNIRRGPGTNYAATGKFTGKGVFTITDVKDGAGSSSGWGKLKSGAGWISLDYAKRV